MTDHPPPLDDAEPFFLEDDAQAYTLTALPQRQTPGPADALQVLRDVFGYGAFRGGQAEIVEHVSAGGDALVLMPTGGGKSLCYQVPAIARHRAGQGVTLVVSPLIALMHDQVGALDEAGVKSAFLNSTLEGDEARRVERLEQWPAVVQAWNDARVSAAQVDVIIGAVPRRFVALFADHAESVVSIISELDVANTEVAIRQWVRCAENADGPEQFHEPASGLHFDRLLDDRFVLNGQFDSAEAAIIDAALRDFDVPDPVDADGQPIGESRSLAQRNADALLEVCRFAVAHRQGAGDTGRFLPHVSLVVDVNELRASALRPAKLSRSTRTLKASAFTSSISSTSSSPSTCLS
jgi:hypothetical protein